MSHLHKRAAAACSLKTNSTTTYIALHAPYTITLFNSKFIIMVSLRPTSESLSGERTTNVPKSDYPSADDIRCLDTSSNTFYSVKLSSPLGSSYHNLISVTCSIASVLLKNPHKRRCFWHFNSAKWENIRQYYSDFSLDNYCFRVRYVPNA